MYYARYTRIIHSRQCRNLYVERFTGYGIFHRRIYECGALFDANEGKGSWPLLPFSFTFCCFGMPVSIDVAMDSDAEKMSKRTGEMFSQNVAHLHLWDSVRLYTPRNPAHGISAD